VTLTRLLLASTAISLSGLGFSHATPFNLPHALPAMKPAVMRYITQVQISAGDAEAALAAAVARQAEVEASGGDLTAAQADVAAAQAALAAAQTEKVQEAVEPVPVQEPAPEPETPAAAAPDPTPEAASEPVAVEEAPVAEPAAKPEVATEPEVVVEPTPEQSAAPAAEAPPAEEAPVDVAPAPDPVPETTVAPEEAPVAADPAPEQAVPETKPSAEPEKAAEPAPEAVVEPAPAEKAVPTPEPKPAATAEPEPETAPETAPAEPTPAEAEATSAPAEPAVVPEAKPSQDAQPDTDAKTPIAPKEEVLTLPVEGGAPVLDSAKEAPAPGDGKTAVTAPASSEPAPPPPASDSDSQSRALRSEPAPQALSEVGERVNAAPAPETQTNVTIINQVDNRTIIEVDNRTIIEHDDRDRLRAGSEEVYYERLRGGRVREVIVRPNGVQLVTITNRWGDVIQRTRVMPDGREYVLFYANANNDGSREAFVDPGRELPALRLSIPIDEYILDSTDARPSAFLDFLMEPPVEQVERLYSVEEVRRSARIRDKVRRIDMDSLTFEFGKATIAEDQIQRLSDVADAMTKILDGNPAETFLIEGHTDAVGRDDANLLLSDRRAETIAVALSDVFGIPPENLITQGYGERYLKVRTEAPERLNRRVTIRRITPLVTPVASR